MRRKGPAEDRVYGAHDRDEKKSLNGIEPIWRKVKLRRAIDVDASPLEGLTEHQLSVIQPSSRRHVKRLTSLRRWTSGRHLTYVLQPGGSMRGR